MALAAAAGISLAAGALIWSSTGARAAGKPERHLVATPLYNPQLAKAAGFPTDAQHINRTADGTLSWMMTPQERQRQARSDAYLAAARKQLAASIQDGRVKASESLFGLVATSTTYIPGGDLQSQNQTTMAYRDVFGGSLNCPSGEGDDEYATSVQLPSGALVTGFTAYGFDSSAVDDPTYYLYQVCNTPSGVSGAIVGSATVTSGFTGGYYALSSAALSHTVDNSDCSYRVIADTSSSTCDGGETVQGVAIRWKRQISPDPVSSSFTDVPTGSTFHREVEAMAASGITGGCGGGKFCPDAPVTRGQMAAYLSRALGLHWPNN